MGKSSKEKLKRANSANLSATPSFEFDLDFADGGQRNILDDHEDQSIASSASKKIMKKVKNMLSNKGLDGLSTHSKKKKGSSQKNLDYIDAGPDDQSIKNGKVKKKKKSKSVSALGTSKSGSFSNGFDDDISVRKKKSKRKKKKEKDDDDDDDKSVGSSRSTRSKKSVRSIRRAKSKSNLGGTDVDTMLMLKKQRHRIKDMEIENAALLHETATVRKQLSEAEKALKIALSEQNPQQTNNTDLQRELEEYEDAVIEKDELIQKLTDAVDTQLDKVEVLEEKLVRTEDEFCKMEEEMKEMEFVIDDLRGRPPSQVNCFNGHGDGDKMLDEEILEQLEERKREVEKREQELLEKETSVKQQEEELKMKRSSLPKPQNSFNSDKRDTSNNVDELEAKIAQLEAKNNDLEKETECLRQQNTGTAANGANGHEEELRSLRASFEMKVEDANKENELLRQQLDGSVHNKNTNEGELESLRNNFEKKIADSKLENEILQQELDGFKERKNAEFEALRQQITQIKMQKAHVEASSRQMRRLESMRMMEESSGTLDATAEEDEEFGLEVEVEIAELREKIVEQEQHSMKLKQEIGSYINENEDLKQELEEREIEMKDLENQLSATKETSAKKMKQKDETITFMQQTMMQINQEKQDMDKKLRGSNLDRTQTRLMARRAEDDEAEIAKFESINAELRKLDEENRRLEEELNQYKYNSSLRYKEKESAFLELQEELRDVKWELGTREKGADYITLLKDRKERKNQLNKARRELKEAEEKILELERQSHDILSNKKDLEKEIKSLNNSEGNAEQISGLKRQIKSLKQHNTTLERKLETESRDSEDILIEKEAKIQILEYELHKIRNNPGQTVRGAVSGFITGLGKMDGEGKSIKIDNVDSTAKENGKGGNIWSLFGQRKELPKKASDNNPVEQNSSSGDSMMPGIGSDETL